MSEYRELLLIYDDDNWGVDSLDNTVVEGADKNAINWRNPYAVVERTDPSTNTNYQELCEDVIGIGYGIYRKRVYIRRFVVCGRFKYSNRKERGYTHLFQ